MSKKKHLNIIGVSAEFMNSCREIVSRAPANLNENEQVVRPLMGILQALSTGELLMAQNPDFKGKPAVSVEDVGPSSDDTKATPKAKKKTSSRKK